MSGLIQSYKKAKKSPVAKGAFSKANAHRQRALAAKQRRVRETVAKAAERARREAIAAKRAAEGL